MAQISRLSLYRRLTWHLSWLGRIKALTLLAGAAGTICIVLAVRHIDELERQGTAYHRTGQGPAPSAAPVRAAGEPRQAVRQFFKGLPGSDASAGSVAEMMELLQRHGLQAQRGQYAVSHDKSGALTYYQIVLPVRGTYRAVRLFINQALHDLPSLALDRVSFSRSRIDDTVVEAQLRFTLLMQAPAAGR